MSADTWLFDSDKLDDAIARRGCTPEEAALIREFLSDPKLRVRPAPPSGDATEHHRTILPEQPGG